jgi:hypothetical protein
VYSVAFGVELEALVVTDGALVVVVSRRKRGLGSPVASQFQPRHQKKQQQNIHCDFRSSSFTTQWQHKVERQVDDAGWRLKMIQIR